MTYRRYKRNWEQLAELVLYIVRSLQGRILCEAYEVGFDFVSPRNNNHNHPQTNLADSHTGAPSYFVLKRTFKSPAYCAPHFSTSQNLIK